MPAMREPTQGELRIATGRCQAKFETKKASYFLLGNNPNEGGVLIITVGRKPAQAFDLDETTRSLVYRALDGQDDVQVFDILQQAGF